MSPTASPPPVSVSPPPSQIDEHEHAQHDTSDLSQQSIDMDTSFSSSDGNNAKHPRAKRKRTSAHDRLVLEEAYQRDSKPEKFARLEIVSMTTMTEKEVQVWFQNRRQNDRRRSKPLTQQELANLQNHGIRPVTDMWRGVISPLKVIHNPVAVSDPVYAPGTSPTGQEREEGHVRSSSEAGTGYTRPVAVEGNQEGLPSPNELSRSFPNVGYLSNRRREAPSLATPASSHRPSGSYGEFSFSLDRAAGSPTAPHLYHGSVTPTNSQSQMRLSCSLDGKAELIPRQQPSPPQSQPSHPPLQRSYSANAAAQPSSSPSEGLKLPGIASMLVQAASQPPPPPRLGRGRSRTARAWESCATAETRDELTAMAENESNGSAAASISLIRSASNTALQPSSGAKRNASAVRPRPQQAKRAKLGRTTSSVARLETTEKKGIPVTSLIATSGADSDKENLSPDEDGASHPRRRPLPSGRAPPAPSRRRGVLQEGRDARPLLNGRANTAPLQRKGLKDKDVAIFEDVDENDDEIERFMSRASVSPGKKGEMEVAAVLSSLKGGSWAAPVNALR